MRHDGVPCALPRQSNESGIIPQHIVAQSRATAVLLFVFMALCSGLCPEANAAQRDRSNKPLPAPLLPAEAWNVVLPSPASAAGALDAERVYIPLQSGQLVALNRETGVTEWSLELELVGTDDPRWRPLHGNYA